MYRCIYRKLLRISCTWLLHVAGLFPATLPAVLARKDGKNSGFYFINIIIHYLRRNVLCDEWNDKSGEPTETREHYLFKNEVNRCINTNIEQWIALVAFENLAYQVNCSSNWCQLKFDVLEIRTYQVFLSFQ